MSYTASCITPNPYTLQVMSQSCKSGGCPSLMDFLAVCLATEGCVAGISAQQQHDLRPMALPAQLALWQVSTGESAALLWVALWVGVFLLKWGAAVCSGGFRVMKWGAAVCSGGEEERLRQSAGGCGWAGESG